MKTSHISNNDLFTKSPDELAEIMWPVCDCDDPYKHWGGLFYRTAFRWTMERGEPYFAYSYGTEFMGERDALELRSRLIALAGLDNDNGNG